MKVQATGNPQRVIIVVAPTSGQKTDSSATAFGSSINAAYNNSSQKFGNNGHKLNLMA